MTEWNSLDVTRWMLEAGKTALKYYETSVKVYKSDASIVTEADLEIEAFFASFLDHPDKGSYLIGEETLSTRSEDYVEEAFSHCAWIVDPIDGTAPYSNRLPTWGVSLGFMEKGVITQGAIFLAALGELYLTTPEGVYLEVYFLWDDHWIQKSRQKLEPLKTAVGGTISQGSMLSMSQQLARLGGHQVPHYWQVTGSSVYALTQLLTGRYSAHITRFRLWDFAGGLPLLQRLGFLCQFADGREFGAEMNDEVLVKEKGDPQRWSTRGQVIFCQSQDDWEYLRSRMNWPQD